MRIAEYKKIDERTEEYTVTIPKEYDEEGNILVEEHEEVRTRTVPVMGMVYRDATPEEIAEMQKQQEQLSPEEPTRFDCIEAQMMYTALMTDTLLEEMEEQFMFEKIMKFFKMKLYTKKQIHQFAEKGVITPEQYKQITGDDFQ